MTTRPQNPLALSFRKNKPVLVCAVLCFACALLSFALFMVQDGGAFTLREDFDYQQLPFTMGLHNQVLRGGLAGWCWNLDLGTSAVQGFGFYELGSPFFWASMLAPADAFPYIVGWLYILKYTVAGVAAHLFLRRFVGSPDAATAGALLYAFSGFQTANLLFYHFHDVVALFPFLLIGLERLMANRRDRAPFALAVCVNALLNYFFFVQSTIFLLVYFGVRFGPDLWRKGGLTGEKGLMRAVGRCLAIGLVGVAMAGILLVPSFVYMLSNPRAGFSALSADNIVWNARDVLFQLQGALLPADTMHDHNAIVAQQWNSTSCWLPMVGGSLVLTYLHGQRGKGDWLSHLLVVLLVICLSPLLTSAFTLFKNVYQRWWYMLVLMMALASARVIDTPDNYNLRFGICVYAALLAAFVGIVLAGSQVFGIVELFHADRFALYAGIAVLGLAATYTLLVRKSAGMAAGALLAPRTGALICGIALFGIVSTALTIGYYRQNLYTGELLNSISEEEQNMGTLDALALGTQLAQHDAQYRYATGNNQLTLPGEAAGTSSFSSTISAASGRFDKLFDTPATNVWHLNKSTVPGLVELLGGAYVVTTNPYGTHVLDNHTVAGTTYYVSRQDACPMGVMYEQYVTTDDVQALPLEQRAIALMQAPAVTQQDQTLVEGYATRTNTDELDLTQEPSSLARDAQAHAVKDFWRNDYGFGFTCNATSDALVYLAVPHDDGWSATVDGAAATVVDSAGMMILPMRAGAHEVMFSYETPGLRAGALVSAVGWLAFAALLAGSHVRARARS